MYEMPSERQKVIRTLFHKTLRKPPRITIVAASIIVALSWKLRHCKLRKISIVFLLQSLPCQEDVVAMMFTIHQGIAGLPVVQALNFCLDHDLTRPKVVLRSSFA